jgi:hypothetical protein
MKMEKSDLTLRAENIIKSCADGYTRVSCSVQEPKRSGAELPYVLTCDIVGPSAKLDKKRLLELVNGEERPRGGIAATIEGEKHDLYVTINSKPI